MCIRDSKDTQCNSTIVCGTARCKIPAPALSNEHDLGYINIVTTDRKIDNGRYDLLPVGPERDAPFDEQLTLSGTVEDQGVVAARQRSRSIPEKRLLGSAVIATDRNDQRAACLIDRAEIAWKRHVLKGNRHLLGRARHCSRRSLEGVALAPIRVSHYPR